MSEIRRSLASDHVRAFTLVEMSIVLVVIALIVGGAMVGAN